MTLDSLIEQLEKLRSTHGGDTEVRVLEVITYSDYETQVTETSSFSPDLRDENGETYVFIGE